MKKLVTLITIFALAQFTLQSQSEYMVLLHTETQFWKENVREYASQAFISAPETIDGNYYRFLQFYEIPNQSLLDALANAGIQLLEYIPNRAYVAAIPDFFDVSKFSNYGIRTILPIVPDMKMSIVVKNNNLPEWAEVRGQAELMLTYYKNLRHEDVLNYCKLDGIKVLQHNGYNNILHISVPKERMQDIAALPYVSFIEAAPHPGEPEDLGGRTLHRANTLDTNFPSGRHYTGAGVGVLCRDNGGVGPHIDFTGRISQEFANGNGTGHEDHVSGIMAGAGNLDPRVQGMAVGADLFAKDYVASFLDETMMLFFDHNVLVTNSSFGNGCNDGYTSTAVTVDDQIYDNPTLLHVFSCGNSGSSNCDYGAGAGWGNITGGHKQGKNAIATASLNAIGVPAGSSSHGPAHDGRIKPDIAANGANVNSTGADNDYFFSSGTSMASPGIVGVTALLHEAYRDHNGGETAESGLLKGIMLNTANDGGNPGPDFEFGWGQVNALRAVMTIEENRFVKTSIMQGDTNYHTITIPEGVTQARVMTYWMEPPAAQLTTKSLVNDLDTRMIDTSGTEYLPWVLDHTPNAANLSAPATKGPDHLNNMEQVAINNPVAGDYTLEVSGFELPFGEHEYYVIWEFRTEEVTLTYPIGGEYMVPGEQHRIHWDAEGDTGDFTLYYSSDAGNSWSMIVQLGGHQRQYQWNVPNLLSGDCLVRIERDTFSDTSDAHFNIAPVPQNLSVVKVCPDYATVTWDSLAEATSYDVFVLGQKYMDSVVNTTATMVDVPINNGFAEQWFSVRMRDDSLGVVGQRMIAVQYEGGLLDCQLTHDVVLVDINSPNSGNTVLCDDGEFFVTIEVANQGLSDQDSIMAGYQLNAEPVVLEMIPNPLLSGDNYTHTFSVPIMTTGAGDYDLKTWINAQEDQIIVNDTASIDFSLEIIQEMPISLAYQHDFESPSNDYFIINNDNQITWEIRNGLLGSDGAITSALYVNNYLYNSPGQEDVLLTLPLDLTNVASALLKFDYAYTWFAGFDPLFDGFKVEVLADCGFNKQVLFEKDGMELATAPGVTGAWTPQSIDHWSEQVFDLAPYLGGVVFIKFTAINGYGNNLYLDNINIDLLQVPTVDFAFDNQTGCPDEPISITNQSQADFATYEWDFGLNADPGTSTDENPTVTFSQVGTETVTLTVTNDAGSSQVSKNIDILPMPTSDFTFSIAGGTVTFTNTSTDATSYSWDFGDNGMSTQASPIYAYTAINTYEVTLTATNDCGSTTTTQTVDIMVGTSEEDLNIQVHILPNPTDTEFDLLLMGNHFEELEIELLDLRGVVLERKDLSLDQEAIMQRFDVSELASGVYYLKIQGEEGVLTRKVIVE